MKVRIKRNAIGGRYISSPSKLEIYMCGIFILLLFLVATESEAADAHLTGKVTSLMGHGTDPGIRVAVNQSPNLCDGGTYGWLRFKGTAQERQWMYSTALAMSLAGKIVTVYTNTDGAACRIHNIQITSGLAN